MPSYGAPRKPSLTEIANDRISFHQALAWVGIHTGMRERGMKVDCPVCGGDNSLRVWPDHGWCVDTETEILTRRGWLRWNEVTSADWALTYRDQATRWEAIQTVVRLPAARRRMLSMETKVHSSLTTGDHRWLVRSAAAPRVYTSSKRLSERRPWESFTTSAAGFRANDGIPLIGGPCATLPVTPRCSDAFVELVAWFFTEGQVKRYKRVKSPGVSIWQSHRVNPGYCERIRLALTACFGPPVVSLRGGVQGWREARRERMTEFIVSRDLAAGLLQEAPGRVVRPEFVCSLTRAQLLLFVETALDGDGSRIGSWSQLCQKERDRLDAFQMALLLLGRPARIWRRENAGTRGGEQKAADWACQLLNRQNVQPARNPKKVQWVEHDGPVWCVQTPSGTWVARRNGTTYVTGNCFSCRKYLSAVTLLARHWDMRNPDAAFLALDKIGYVPPGYEELWDEARRGPEPARESLGEALRIWCEANCPGWSARQFEPALAVPLSRCLGLLPSVRTEEECDEWLTRCKRVMGKALELALAK
jgi:hypothetical protein